MPVYRPFMVSKLPYLYKTKLVEPTKKGGRKINLKGNSLVTVLQQTCSWTSRLSTTHLSRDLHVAWHQTLSLHQFGQLD